jgi:hypothetical protein
MRTQANRPLRRGGRRRYALARPGSEFGGTVEPAAT